MSHFKDSIYFASSTDLQVPQIVRQNSTTHSGLRPAKLTLYDEFERFERSGVAKFEKYLANARALSFGEHIQSLSEIDKGSSKSNDQKQSKPKQKKSNVHRDRPIDHSQLRFKRQERNTAGSDGFSILADLERIPFVADMRPPFNNTEHGLSDVSVHSDNEILGDVLKRTEDDDSWEDNHEQNMVDDDYNSIWDQETSNSKGVPERLMSPGQYFGARSLPLESINDLWNEPVMASPTSFKSQHSSQSGSKRIPWEKQTITRAMRDSSRDQDTRNTNVSSSHGELTMPSIPKPRGIKNSKFADPLWTTKLFQIL
ncbi:hypothetical protein CLU79DRAFT_357691 [Phycomyces nitens]|nr:hypothetical protein CLU79DRAFT_357691 [Phycomyces nitens]